MIQITVEGRRASVSNKELLTSGSAGIEVQFTLDEAWELAPARTAVFRVGDDGNKYDVPLDNSLTCVVPPECLTVSDEVLFIGIYGGNGSGTIIIPTIWVSAGVIRPGTEPNTPREYQPTPSAVEQIHIIANRAEQTATDAMTLVEEGLSDLSTLESTVQGNDEQRQQNETQREADFNTMMQSARAYVLEPSVSAIVYDPNAASGEKISPTNLSIDAYYLSNEGDRGGFVAPNFEVSIIPESGTPTTAFWRNTTGVSLELPQTITPGTTVQARIWKNNSLGLPMTLAEITIPVVANGEHSTTYILQPDYNIVEYDPNAAAGSRFSPSSFSVYAYKVTGHGKRERITDLFLSFSIGNRGGAVLPGAAGLVVDLDEQYDTPDQHIIVRGCTDGNLVVAQIEIPIVSNGLKGDPFTYADFTEEQKTELVQGPILDAQTSAVAAVNQAGTNQVAAVNSAGATQTAAAAEQARLAGVSATNASNSAAAATTAKNDAVTAKDAAVAAKNAAETAETNAEAAQTAAEDAAASVSSSAAQITQNASDISELSRQLSATDYLLIGDGESNINIWESGSINGTGGNMQSSARIRTKSNGLIGYTAGQLYISCADGYEMFLPAYNQSGTYVGRIQEDGTIGDGPVSWVQNINFVKYSDNLFRIVLRNKTDPTANIVVADAVNVLFYGEKYVSDDIVVYDYETVEVTYESGVYDINNALTETGRHVTIPVIPGEQYKISSYKYSSSYPACLFENGTTLVSYDNTPPSGRFNDLVVTIPLTVNNMVVNGNSNVDISIQRYEIQKYYTARNGEKLEGEVSALFSKTPYLYDDITDTLTFEDNCLDKWNGHSTAIGRRSSINVSEGEEYYYTAFKFSTDYPFYTFRKNGLIVSYYSPSGTGGNISAQIVVPSGVDEMVLNAAVGGFVYLAKKRAVRAMPYSKWDGKKIAWFGTSIPETSTYNPVLGYPQYVGSLLGATVYNEAVGSSCARRGFKTAESADDPYGWTGMGVAALWNMGSTIAEKNEIITNWESKWRNLTGYNVAMTDGISAKALACSYENKLVQKYITENPVDLYVFDHGYNDWKVGNLDIDASNPYDMSTFQGAMNTYIKLILESNPRARIVIISHYEDQERAGLIEMQKEEAEYWNLPFCKLYENLAWAGSRTIDTTGYWGTGNYDNGIWHESGGESRSLTLKQIHMPDGRHPNTDRSGHACMDIAYVIADFINHIMPIE